MGVHGNVFTLSTTKQKERKPMTEITQFERSVLINKYIKILARKLATTNKIAAVVPTDLATELREIESSLEGMKIELKKIIGATNSRRIESTTNFLTLKEAPVKAYMRRTIQVNKELK